MKKLLSLFLCISIMVGFATMISEGVNDGFVDFDIEATSEAIENVNFEVGDYIYYGTYPQTDVTESLGDTLNSQPGTWVSYKYYIGNDYITGDGTMKPEDYMEYIDVQYNGMDYRGVRFVKYRPHVTTLSSSEKNSVQDENGYLTNRIYWFRFEPIKWRILDPSSGLVVCDSIIDSQAYHNYKNWLSPTGANWAYKTYGDDGNYFANNYYHSSIRHWLNNDFYNTAFSDEQKSNINTTKLNNECNKTLDGISGYEEYDSASSDDKVFLLSYDDAINSNYGFDPDIGNCDMARKPLGTDYAKCQGLCLYPDTKSLNLYSICWLRTPTDDSECACAFWDSGRVATIAETARTDIGVCPALYLSQLKSDYGTGEYEGIEPDGMRVLANNTNLSYYINDYIVFAVSNFRNNIESKIDNVIVKSSNNSIIELVDIFEYVDLSDYLHIEKYEELKNCQFVVFKAISGGPVGVTITDSNTGNYRFIPLIISEDKFACLRADSVKTIHFNGSDNVTFNAYFNDVVIADFDYETKSDGYIFSMNIYNHNSCPGVVEVFDANDKLLDARIVEKHEIMTTSLWKTYKAGWVIVGDAVTGKIFDFRSELYTKKTSVTDLFVPIDGYVRVTCDSSISTVCAMDNLVDLAFTSVSMANNVERFITGCKKLSSDDVKLLVKAINSEMVRAGYINFGEKLQKEFQEKLFKELKVQDINAFVSSAFLDIEELLEACGTTLNDVVKTTLKEAEGISEGVLLDCMGPHGLIIKTTFAAVELTNYVFQIIDITKNLTGKASFICYAPTFKSAGKISSQNVVIEAYGNVPDSTVMESYHIISGDQDSINLDTGEIYTEDFEIYEIALLNDNKYVQPDGEVEVSILSPYDKTLVARKNSDGSFSILNSIQEGNLVRFSVNHFCRFALIKINDKNDDTPITEDDSTANSNPTANSKLFIGPRKNTVDYKSNVIIYAKAENVPEDYAIVIVDVDASKVLAWGDNKEAKYTIEQIKEPRHLAIWISKKGNTVGAVEEDADGNKLGGLIDIDVRDGLFYRIIAFFKRLFGSNKVTIEP